jgi:capsule polysaccharide export protein KpsE/RkpR
LLRSDSVALALNQRFALDKHYDVEKFEDVRRKLENRTEARAGRDGVVMVRVTDRDAKVAAALANGYVEELHKLVERLAADETAQRKRFIEAQVHDARKSLEYAEAEFRKLQEAVGAVQLGHVESAYATMGGLRASIMSREVTLRTLALSSTTQNPLYRTIEAEIKALRAQLEKLEQDPQVQNPKFVIPADRAPGLTLEYLRKLRDLRFEEAMYQAVLRQNELVRMEDGREFKQFLIVDSARPATKRDFPQQWMVALFVMLIGLGVAMYGVLTDQLVYPSDFWRKPDNAQPRDPSEL